MRFAVVLNKDGGTLRTTDLDLFGARVTEILEKAGHEAEVSVVQGKEIVAALEKAAKSRSIDVIMAGGGDGTISAAAALLMNKKKALAVLPAGTMNLFARGLGIPQGLEAAVQAFADGEIKAVDIASANGQPFVHQFSVGLHAKMVHLRDKMNYASRLGKMRASMTAAYRTVLNPPSMNVSLMIGDAEIVARTSGIGVSNNLFGEGHLPYADTPDGGVLGIYVTVARQRGELLGLAFNLMRGKWRDNQHVEVHEAERVVLKLKSKSKKFSCVIDGELGKLEQTTVIEIHKKALNVWLPKAATAKKS